MEKGTRTRNNVIGCLANVRNSIMLASKSLLGNDENCDIDEIKDIDDYKPGELSEEDQALINELKNEERKLKRKLEYAKSSLQKQRESGVRINNLKMQIIEKDEK